MFVSEVSQTTNGDGVAMVWQKGASKYIGVAADAAGVDSPNWVVVNERADAYLGAVEVDHNLPPETQRQFVQAMESQAGQIVAGVISWTEL